METNDQLIRAVQVATRKLASSGNFDLLLKDGRIAEALAALEQMTVAFPYDAGGWQNRIGLLRQTGRAAEADEVARIAVRYISPERLRF